jgi:hypothetical protein
MSECEMIQARTKGNPGSKAQSDRADARAARRVDPVELDSGWIDPRPFDRIVVGPIFRTPNAVSVN